MIEKIYRFTCDEKGIYEAVEKCCPKGDKRRDSKPDGSWLLRVGEKYPGAISFWKESGLKMYKNSGLCNWHFSIVEGEAKMLIAHRPDEILYEDEFQIICNKDYVNYIKEYPFKYEGPKPAIKIDKGIRPDFIKHHSEIRDWNAYYPYAGSEESFTLVASIGKELGLKKIGIHHEILQPGKRSSWPHAHKVEEELVYITEGHPDLWINGKLYAAKPGDAIFFPPNTNLAHTVINNSKVSVAMIVLGQQNVSDDLIYYPLHPDRNLECREGGYFWEDRPKIELGSHPGIPLNESLKEKSKWDYQTSTADVKETIVGGENNSIKVFFKSKDLGRSLGAKNVALHFQVLPPGSRSSLPHAESIEEEFVYVLKGSPIVWINGKRYQLEAGDSAAFPSGTGIAHTFINESNQDVELLVSGETTKKNNRCSFPINPEEKEFCEIWWDDAPIQEISDESSLPNC